jgi:Mce-associated membrane protein
MNPTLYDVLGVSRDASREEIRKAWRESADRFEPGEGGSTKQFRLFNEAAEVLLDPERRKAYDATLGDEAEDTPEAVAPDKTEPKSPAGKVPGPPMPGASSAAAPETVAPTPRPRAPWGSPTRSTTATTAPSSLSSKMLTLLILFGILAAVAVGLGAWKGSQGWRALQEQKQAERYQEALDTAPAAAESAAAAVLSYDYRSLEADRDAAAKFLSDGYREEYVDTFDKLVVESATQTKAAVEAQVLASAAMNSGERDPSKVPVLLFVNQTTSSAASAEPSVALNRVRLDMVEVNGTWLVDGITSY